MFKFMKKADAKEQASDKIENQKSEDKDLLEIDGGTDNQIQPKESFKDAGLRELVEKNIKWSQVIYQQNKTIKNRLTLMVIGSYLRLFLILAPIIFAIIFLPPFIKELMSDYGGLLTGQVGSQTSIMEEVNKFLQQNNINSLRMK